MLIDKNKRTHRKNRPKEVEKWAPTQLRQFPVHCHGQQSFSLWIPGGAVQKVLRHCIARRGKTNNWIFGIDPPFQSTTTPLYNPGTHACAEWTAVSSNLDGIAAKYCRKSRPTRFSTIDFHDRNKFGQSLLWRHDTLHSPIYVEK